MSVRIPWQASSAPALLSVVERLQALTEEQNLTLAKAAALIQLQDGGSTASSVREGAVDWQVVVERFRQHLITSGQIQQRTWERRYVGHMQEALDALRGKRAPRTGMELMERLTELNAHRCPPGGAGRFHRVSHVSGLLDFAVERCGAPERFRSPSRKQRQELIGRRLAPDEPSTPLLDDQALRVYRAIPDPKWRLAFGLLVCFGLRPCELPACRPENGALRVQGIKRNQSGVSKDRLVQALDPVGAPGMGRELLALLEERGVDALPHRTVAAYWGTRMRDQLMKLPEWLAVLEEAESTGQGNVVVYSTRHGFAYRGTMTYGLMPRVLAQLMGHTVVVHNSKYGRWVSEEGVASAVLAAVERVSRGAACASLPGSIMHKPEVLGA